MLPDAIAQAISGKEITAQLAVFQSGQTDVSLRDSLHERPYRGKTFLEIAQYRHSACDTV